MAGATVRQGLAETSRSLAIDLTEVTFLDEAGASVLRRLRQRPSVSLVGCHLFTQQMIETVDPTYSPSPG